MNEGSSQPARVRLRKGSRAPAVIALGLVGAAAFGTLAFAMSGPTDPDAAGSDRADAPPPVVTAPPGVDPACVIAQDPQAVLWVPPERFDPVLDNVESAIEERFGEAGAAGTANPLTKGMVGVAVDHAAHEIAVMVDPAKLDAPALERDLRELEAVGVGVSVRPACHGSDDLLRAEQLITERKWHPDVAQTPYDYYLDAYTSSFRVTMPRGDVADALKADLGDLVSIAEGMPSIG